MKQTIDISIDLSKIDKTAFHESPSNGKKYLNMTVLIREEKDQYGQDGFVVQKISKERKASGEKGPIIGNANIVDWDAIKSAKDSPNAGRSPSPALKDEDDDIPF